MGILKIKLADAAGAALAGQTVKVSGAGALQSNAEGMVQFLIENGIPLEIDINGTAAWSGNSSELVKDELFKATGAGFARVNAG